MSTRKILLSYTGRGVVPASIAALVLTMTEPPLAIAGPVAPVSNSVSATASSDATDFSAARRRRHYRRGGNAAGLAFMGLAIGTIGAIAAQERRVTTTAMAMRQAITAAAGRIMAAAITVTSLFNNRTAERVLAYQ